MNLDRLIHSVAFAIPGFLLLGLGSLFIVRPGDVPDLTGATGWLGAGAALMASMVAYVTGAVLWGVAYAVRGVHVVLFVGGSYTRFRLEKTSELLRELKPTSEDSAFVEVRSYAHWRARLLIAQELLPGHLGPRLTAEWEHIGLLQTVMLVWTILLGWLLVKAAFHLTPEAVVPTMTGVWWPALGLVAAVLSTGMAYRVRNLALASNFAAACLAIREMHLSEARDCSGEPDQRRTNCSSD
jgi:hypothetical protein